MIILMQFTNEGIENFREYIHELKKDANYPRPDLGIKSYSEKFDKYVEIDENRIFETRMEMGKYLTNTFEESGITRNDVMGKREMWTWLSYIWLDQLAPVSKGKRQFREDARYVCSLDYTDYFRHYVANAYDLYSLYGEDLTKFFLDSPTYVVSDSVEVFAARQEIISHRNIVELIHSLYWDERSNRAKTGTANRKRAGHTRRLPTVLKQFELTYDIYTMMADEIIELLPSEFDEWKQA